MEVSPATMSKLNREGPVSLEVIMKICAVLECDIGDVVGFVNEN